MSATTRDTARLEWLLDQFSRGNCNPEWETREAIDAEMTRPRHTFAEHTSRYDLRCTNCGVSARAATEAYCIVAARRPTGAEP